MPVTMRVYTVTGLGFFGVEAVLCDRFGDACSRRRRRRTASALSAASYDPVPVHFEKPAASRGLSLRPKPSVPRAT